VTYKRALLSRVSERPRIVGSVLFELAAYSLCLFWLFSSTIESMVAIWWRSDTYSHGFLIAPISAWLIWRQRHRLEGLTTDIYWPALLGVMVAGFIWLVGQLVDALVVQQFALVLLWICGVVHLLGIRVSKPLSFALLFLFFMVPVGEDLVGPMMNFTADFTVWLVKLSGIPVYREGLFFSLPSGNWSVVEACSGVRYLIASFCLGCLYAYLTFQRLSKRLLFVLLALLVPVLANGLRAYGIVMIGHLSDMSLATGVDHLIYGWLFFGLVMLALFSIGALFSDRSTSATDLNQQTQGLAHQQAEAVGDLRLSMEWGKERTLASVLLLLLLILWPLLADRIDARPLPVAQGTLQAPLQVLSQSTLQASFQVSLEERLLAPLKHEDTDSSVVRPPPQWQISALANETWRPASFARDKARVLALEEQEQSKNQILLIEQGYEREQVRLTLFVRHYLSQESGRELITSANRLLSAEQRQWRITTHQTRRVQIAQQTWSMQQAVIKKAGDARLVWSWYQIGGWNTGNHYWAKLLEVYQRLSFGSRGASEITLLLNMEAGEPDNLETAQVELMEFMQQALPSLTRSLEQAELRP